MQIDIGFGDTITPPPVETPFPTILNGPAPLLLTYPKETVVAEKFEAMIKLISHLTNCDSQKIVTN
jgi:hypothetical protein